MPPQHRAGAEFMKGQISTCREERTRGFVRVPGALAPPWAPSSGSILHVSLGTEGEDQRGAEADSPQLLRASRTRLFSTLRPVTSPWRPGLGPGGVSPRRKQQTTRVRFCFLVVGLAAHCPCGCGATGMALCTRPLVPGPLSTPFASPPTGPSR